ncbi:hypothetical protein C4573_00675 [Candidatus Woesearchaeota archaeon]|nr:MAG: hypothetical protein C4573_00675 [Candidatus Woesearchaeota archaeon]
MGLFDFLKKKEEAVFELTTAQIKPYFEAAVRERFANINKTVEDIGVQIKYEIKKIRELIKDLQEAQLMNPDISQREMNVMQGNRDNYCRRIKVFLDNIALAETFIELGESCEEFFHHWEITVNDTQKNHFVLKNYFGDDIAKISRKLQELEKLFIRLKELLEKENLQLVNTIKQQFQDAEESRKKREEYAIKATDAKAELAMLRGEQNKIEQRIASLKESNDYRFYSNFLEQMKSVDERVEAEKKEIQIFFVELERAMKKFAKGSDDALLSRYLEDHVAALLHDDELKILEVFDKLKKDLEKGKVDLKDKKKDKTLSILEDMRKRLKQKRETLLQLLDEQQEVKEKIRKNHTALQIAEQESWLRMNAQNREDTEKKIEQLQHELERVNPLLIMQGIVQNLEQYTGRTIAWKR